MKNYWTILGAIAIAISLLAGSYYQGWRARGDREAAKQLQAQLKAAAELEKERARGDRLAYDLELEKQNIKTVTVEVIKEVPKVTKVYVEAESDEHKPIPPAVITWGAVRLFDRALQASDFASSSLNADASSGSDLARSPADIADILEVHSINAWQYAECRAQLNALIDWHHGKDSKQ